MDLTEIRKTVIAAVFSDDLLMKELALKGGNALNLVYDFGSRSSIDVDLSMEGDLENLEVFKNRLFSSLRREFARAGYVVFDEAFLGKPSSGGAEDWEEWGGYQAEFKIIGVDQFRLLKGDLETIRRNATVVSPLQKRIFKIQISKFEYCAPRTEKNLENCKIYVYTPGMIAVEKLRALCQQMPEYPLVRHKRPRARDFYDIFCIVTEGAVNLGTEANLVLTRNIFAAKRVPLSLIPQIPNYREFHRQDWVVVQDSVSGDLRAFDFYFDFVVQQLPFLESLWVE